MTRRTTPLSSTRSTQPVLEMTDIVKSYGKGETEVYALRGLDLTVAPGEIVAVMGPSGCGKSTLLHLAGALESPSAGRVKVNGADLSDMSAEEQASLRRTEVGYVFQRLNLVPSLTAVENVMLPLELDGVGARAARKAATDALHLTGLDRQLDRYPDDFSGGQQQRIAIARALVSKRSLLLADEPTGSLDTVNSDQIIEMLATLPVEHNTSVVLVTHEPRFASYADRVVYLRDGLIVDDTSSQPFGADLVVAE